MWQFAANPPIEEIVLTRPCSHRPALRHLARVSACLTLVLCVGAVAGCDWLGAPPARSPAVAPGQRDAALWPFATTSPWNTPVGSQATMSGPWDACTASLTEPASPTINATQWSIDPIIATAADPLVAIFVNGVYRATINIPSDARPSDPQVSQDGDAHMVVIDPTHRYAAELWRAQPAFGGWEADSYVHTNLYGPGVGHGGVRAYGGSALGGLIRANELAAGNIPHALALALAADQLRHPPVWPAISDDSFSWYGGNVPMGSLVALPRFIDVDALGFSPATAAIAHALQDYGAYVVDSSANFTFFAEPSADTFIGAARDDFEQLQALLMCVADNGPDSVGGAGSPSAPLAPPIAAP
jgi:hypothetical protein